MKKLSTKAEYPRYYESDNFYHKAVEPGQTFSLNKETGAIILTSFDPTEFVTKISEDYYKHAVAVYHPELQPANSFWQAAFWTLTAIVGIITTALFVLPSFLKP